MRSSCETVETKSDFICSTSRSAEMSRNAKMRPATAPAGSRITASVTESHTSSRPRMIETSGRRAASRCPTRAGPEHLVGRPAERVVGRDAGDLLGRLVPQDDAPVAIDRDDAVGDVGEDREAAFLLERDALVQLGVRRAPPMCSRQARASPRSPLAATGAARVRTRRARRAERPPDRRAGRRGTRCDRPRASGRAHAAARSDAGILERDRRSRLHDVAGEQRRRCDARPDGVVRARARPRHSRRDRRPRAL